VKIRTKCIIAIALCTFLIFVLLHLAAVFILQPSYDEIENQNMGKALNQLDSVIAYRLATLESNTRDYASWDDTYQFVQYKNQEYVDKNFIDTTFMNLNLNFVSIVGQNKTLLFAKSFDVNNSISVPVSDELLSLVTTDPCIWNFSLVNSSVVGIIEVDGQPMMIASNPILTSNNEGPIGGGLLFGTYLDSREISDLAEIADLEFAIKPIQTSEVYNQVKENLLTTEGNVIKEIDANTMSGYQLVKDIHSNPVFILQISESRAIYQQGDLTENIFIAASAATTIGFAVLLIFMLEKYVFKRMTKIASSIEMVAPNEKFKESPAEGLDEISIVESSVKATFNKKLEAMNQVSTMVAHDLRNPLQGIRGATYLLKKDLKLHLSSKDIEMFDTIDNCLEYSNKIVQDLLDYSNVDVLNRVSISVKALITDTLTTISIPSNIQITNGVEDGLVLQIDKTKIIRVFNNLIKNALDAMPNGGILDISSNKIKKYVRIDFADTGLGMSKDVLEKLWHPFFTTKARGMGVGLAITKRIIEAHDGEVKVESVEGKGTTFSVYLPIAYASHYN
jgi:signal transduction histidine kinase